MTILTTYLLPTEADKATEANHLTQMNGVWVVSADSMLCTATHRLQERRRGTSSFSICLKQLAKFSDKLYDDVVWQTLISECSNTWCRPMHHRDEFVVQSMIRWIKQGVGLTGRNTTGPPCSVTVELQLDCRWHDVIDWPAPVKPPAGPPWSVTDPDRRQQTPASVTSLTPTICVGGPVKTLCVGGPVKTLCVGGPVMTLCVGGPVMTLCVGGPVVTLCVGGPVVTLCVGGPVTRDSAVAEGPHVLLCQLKYCQMLQNFLKNHIWKSLQQLNVTLKVIQGHWKWRHSMGHISIPTSGLRKQRLHVALSSTYLPRLQHSWTPVSLRSPLALT